MSLWQPAPKVTMQKFRRYFSVLILANYFLCHNLFVYYVFVTRHNQSQALNGIGNEI
jgi:hypothetical protein